MPDLDLALFDEPERVVPPPEPETTAGERMRRRQAERIAAGYHPLGAPLRLHPDASRAAVRTAPGPRCGGCQYRQVLGGHSRGYPKCVFGERVTEIPPEQRREYGPTQRIVQPRVTGGEASDVRAWWPACVDYQAAP